MCKHGFGKELTELADGSDYNVNAYGYLRVKCRLLADSYAAIKMGEPEATLVMHVVISCLTSAWTGGEIGLSNIGENTTTPSTQLCKVSEAIESVLI